VIGSEQGKDAEQQQRELDGVRRQLEDHVITLKEYEERVNAINKSYADMAKLGNSALHGVKEGLQSYLDSIGTLADSIGNAVKGTLGKLEDALINFANTGKLNFRDLANYAIQQLERIVIEQAIMKPLTGALKGFLGGFGFANGGIMSAAGPVPLRTYATGGIATSPQMALFGEGSTPEAYVPLPDGRRIPVAMKGGGSTPVINVAVDAKGTSVTGNSGQASQLARVIAVAVQNELIKQKRPGGLIAA
jgi:lambda family phage tail tape measure protein